jgi:hypothetical protein
MIDDLLREHNVEAEDYAFLIGQLEQSKVLANITYLNCVTCIGVSAEYTGKENNGVAIAREIWQRTAISPSYLRKIESIYQFNCPFRTKQAVLHIKPKA